MIRQLAIRAGFLAHLVVQSWWILHDPALLESNAILVSWAVYALLVIAILAMPLDKTTSKGA